MTAYKCQFDNLLIVDFSTTSERNLYDYPPEIIQFTVSVLDVRNKRIREDISFNEYCKPVINKKLTDYCIETTGVSQSDVDAARPFKDVYDYFVTWLRENNFEEEKFAFACHNEETIWKNAQYQFLLNKTPLPRIFRQWYDVSFPYLIVTRQPTYEAPQNYLIPMAAYNETVLEERFDSRSNTISLARIVQKVLEKGHRVDINTRLTCVDDHRENVFYWDKSIAWQTDRALFFRIEQHILPLMFRRQMSEFDTKLLGNCAWCRMPSEICNGLEYKQSPSIIYKGLKLTNRQLSEFAEYLDLGEV